MLALLLPLLLAAAPADETPAPLASRITEVVVHGSSARVHRTTQVPGSGRYLLAGLPGSLDEDAVRVRVAQGSVVGVEVADRWQQAVPDAEVQALRDQIAALDWQIREVDDRRAMLKVLREGVERLLAPPEPGREHATQTPDPAAWKQVLAFASEQIATLAGQTRDAERAGADLTTRRKDLQTQLGRLQGGQDVKLHDVVVEVLVPGPAALDVEYLVGNAGWEPLYDLRTSADGKTADLAYRARIWQHTGESWDDVALVLSTSRPERGARGPEPQPLRLHIEERHEVPAAESSGRSSRHTEKAPAAAAVQLRALGYTGDDKALAEAAPEPTVSVESFGLSVQFRLPHRESVPSRERPVTVLVGQQALDVTLQRLCVPALDTTVWVRGLTKNSTPWTMLPGTASVYFGQDYVGPARFDEPVLPQQEFTLHLGADPGVKVERTKTAELHEEPGMFTKDQVETAAWRVRLSNQGSLAARADGSIEVFVREAVPLSADERIEVEVSEENRKWATDERWLKECKEQGIRTWSVVVPGGGVADVTWKVITRWPDNLRLESGS